MFAIIDCGTTNTRIYIVNDNEEIIGRVYNEVGVRDTLINDKDFLANSIMDMFNEVTKQNNINIQDLDFIISSGMITSEIGLMEVPHIAAPVSINDIANNVVVVEKNIILPIDVPMILVPGVKNSIAQKEIGLDSLGDIDIMRGEELQVYGALDLSRISNSTYIIFLTSHTKLVMVNEKSKIDYCTTTFSGQFYKAVNMTSFGKSIKYNEDEQLEHYTYEEILDTAYDLTMKTGILRSVVISRFMDTMLDTNGYERNLYLGGVIAAEDMKAIKNFMKQHKTPYNRYIIVGKRERCDIYANMLGRLNQSSCKIHIISSKEEIDSLTIKGMIKLKRLLNLNILLD